MNKPIRILGIAGSLRRASYNRSALRAAVQLAPEGATRAQYHLRQIFVFLNMFPINQPEVMIGHAADRFDKDGNLTDETTKEFIRQLLTNLVAWTRRLQQPQPR